MAHLWCFFIWDYVFVFFTLSLCVVSYLPVPLRLTPPKKHAISEHTHPNLPFRPEDFELHYQELLAFVFCFIFGLFVNNHQPWEGLDGSLLKYWFKNVMSSTCQLILEIWFHPTGIFIIYFLWYLSLQISLLSLQISICLYKCLYWLGAWSLIVFC